MCDTLFVLSEARPATYIDIKMEHSHWKWVVILSQISIYPVLLLIRMLLVRRNIVREARIEVRKQPHIVYANHQSLLDPFLICASLSPRTIFKLIPFRFFAKNSLFDNPISAFFLQLFGGFPASVHPSKPYGLDHARRLIHSNQTIIIFPQGMRTTKKIAKPGISALATEPNVRLVPAAINWHNRLNCEIRIGKAFQSIKPKQPDELMEIVYQLF